MKKIKKEFALFLFILAAVFAFAFFFAGSKASLKEKFLHEFTGAYAREVKKSGTVVELELTASEGEIEIFDGVKTRVWNYNGSVPGPEIRIKLGDSLRILFKNKLPQESTVHFHGVRVPNAMDGVPGVTQPPVEPGGTFLYEFTPKDAGTFWFHPHVRSAEQVERGLFGTLVVEDENSEKYTQDKVMVLDDWRLDGSAQVDENFLTPMDLMHDGRWGNVITVNGKLKEKLKARPGARILLRFVNSSNARVYSLSFGKLKAVAVAVDGMYVREPFDANGFDIAPGNRLDVDITVPKKEGTYTVFDTFTGRENALFAVEAYGVPLETPEFAYPNNPRVPRWEGAARLSPDKEYVLSARRVPGAGMMGKIEWTINGKAYPDYDPFTFKYGVFNTFRFKNDSARLHPMHLHGQFFKVTARNGKEVDEGFFRDTVLIYPGETFDLALVPLDRGRWANHCHILEHADAGMMTVVEVE